METVKPTDRRRYESTIDHLPPYNRGKIVASMIPDGSRVLEIGCGPGQLADYIIRKKGCQVTGIDWSEESLVVARKRGVKTIKYNLNEGLPPLDMGEFDILLATEILEHIIYPENLVKDILGVIGGRTLIVTLPSATYWKTRLKLLFGQVDNVITGDPTADGSEPFIHHFHVFDRRLMLQLLGGFEILEERCPGRVGIPTLAIQIIFKCRKKG